MRSQTEIFSKRVKDFMHMPEAAVSVGTPCCDVVALMSDKKTHCCVVSDTHNKLAGILRSEDILNKIVFKVSEQTVIEDVMVKEVQTIAPHEYLYHAIGRMRRYGICELVVVDETMQPVGMIYLKEAVEAASSHFMQQIDRLSAEGSLESLRDVKDAQVELAHDMFKDQVAASLTQRLLSHVNNDTVARIISANLTHMEAEGWGAPPVEFCAIVMGSGGRGENYLYPDQDNGFILEDYPDEDHNRVDHFFRELAKRMCDDLNEVGFPYCEGHVMATNPLWRKTLSQWIKQVKLWGKKRNSVALRLADIFFDFQPVWGKVELADDLRASVLQTVQANHFFLQEMYHAQRDHRVAINLFGRLIDDPSDEAHKRMVDLKYRGFLPLVEGVRLLSLKAGIGETSTLKRIEKLHEAKALSENEADYLSSAFRFITQLLLKRQVREYESKQPVTRFVKIRRLSKREKDSLINSLRHIESFRKRLKGEFTGDVY
ncbi:putative signal-transduction protein with CBS domains [Candidatus Terasakiella magnetica]|uniref:Putative signal-transduction protein with CBS domains n=1 Tax=Candidatus Terasakiella magnetica TaxID=1867952 RepID=A0A1C3RJ80_9PROT|nr:DUF294 nucleotidyltransferase-like domain-containing protein [Candidatus Terasakiella magnetica]SCA57320.1 putative signal-transduction protein with CBS domains [Candidatus Terasakiella magnetica]